MAYNGMVTQHGLVMLFGFVMPVAIGGYGNMVMPIGLGASELVMPRMNGLSMWALVLGVMALGYSSIGMNGLDSGWTLYAPLSTTGTIGGIGTDIGMVTLHVLGVSSGVASINMIATCMVGRSTGTSLMGMGLQGWSIVITSGLLVGALPVLGVGITGLLMDRNVASGVYDGDMGGDAVMYQHLFWFFGHPEVYVIILPVFGIVSIAMEVMQGRSVFGRDGMVYCMVAIGLVGYVVWAHHMLTVGLDIDTRAYFSAATALVGIPTAVKVFSYSSGMMVSRGIGGSIGTGIMAFVGLFTAGGLTGVMLSNVMLDIGVHDTYFVVAHFHTVLSLGAVYGLVIGQWAFGIGMVGNMGSDGQATSMTVTLTIGAILVFGIQHLDGIAGHGRRVLEASAWTWTSGMVSSVGLVILVMTVSGIARMVISGLVIGVKTRLRVWHGKWSNPNLVMSGLVTVMSTQSESSARGPKVRLTGA